MCHSTTGEEARYPASDWSQLPLALSLLKAEHNRGDMDTSGTRGRMMVNFTGTEFVFTWAPIVSALVSS